MRLIFDEITERKRQYSISSGQWFPAVEGVSVMAAAASLEVSRKDAQTALLRGEIVGSLRMVCDRCSEPYVEELCCDFVYLATTREEAALDEGEREVAETEELTLYLKDAVIEVDELLAEQVHLAIPQKRLCSEQCRGICVGCGAVLNQDPCHCPEEEKVTPFTVLKRLQKQ
jgi:uncharacterized protein